jgi:RNA polymerase sigma-70 factor (ECF subfamily)
VDVHGNRQARLAGVFVGDEKACATAELGDSVAAFCDRGRSAWPDLGLSDEAFCQYLGARLAADDLKECDSPVAGDLFLACACLVGVPGASDQLLRSHRAAIQAALSHMLGSADQEEILQRIWESFLVAKDGEHPPRLALYKGRGPLRAFLRVAAIRLAISLLRRNRPVAAVDDEIQRLADDGDNPEMKYLKTLYRDEFRRSFATALATLPAAQQLLLRLDVVDELTIDEAALVYGRSRTTTGRHLLEARRAVAQETLNDLQTRLGLPPSEMDSVARLVRSQLDLSVNRLLRAGA